MSHDDLRCELTQHFHHPINRFVCQPEWIISQIEAFEAGANDLGCLCCLLMPDSLDILYRLVRLLPQLARFSSFSIRKGEDECFTTICCSHRN